MKVPEAWEIPKRLFYLQALDQAMKFASFFGMFPNAVISLAFAPLHSCCARGFVEEDGVAAKAGRSVVGFISSLRGPKFHRLPKEVNLSR